MVRLVKAPPHQLVVGFFSYRLELMAMTQGISEPVVIFGASGQVGLIPIEDGGAVGVTGNPIHLNGSNLLQKSMYSQHR